MPPTQSLIFETDLDAVSPRLSGPDEEVRAQHCPSSTGPLSHDDPESREAAPSRMGGATGSAERTTARPSLLDRLIEERRRGDCADPRRAPRPAERPADEPSATTGLPAAAPSPAAPAPRAPLADGERSLAGLVSATWESLSVAETAACFVCGGDILPRFGAGARPVGGRCTDCGSELS